jgi:hypothetical protein
MRPAARFGKTTTGTNSLHSKDPKLARIAGDRHEATVREIAQEKAASLGRAGRRLEDCLAKLRRHDAERGGDEDRAALVEAAAEALYFYIVQREACGLRDSIEIFRELRVPTEIQVRMGVRRKAGP